MSPLHNGRGRHWVKLWWTKTGCGTNCYC